MKTVLLNALLLAALLAPAASPSFEGPLAVRNQFPLFMHVDSPRLESAAAGTAFNAGISYSSIFLVRSSASWDFGIDAELAELSLRYGKAFGPLELDAELPVYFFSGGFMDGFLEGYHKAFGFSDYGRSARPKNQFLYEVRRDGALVVKGSDSGPGIGDLRLSAKYMLLKEDPAVALRADFELPTGAARKGFGSGGLDAGAALLLDKRISDTFKAYLNIGAVFPGDLKAHETVELDNFLYAGAALEAALWKKLSLVGQVIGQGSPFPKTGVGSVDRTSVLLTFGGRYAAGKEGFEFSLSEDPNTAGAPDVTFNLSYKRRF